MNVSTMTDMQEYNVLLEQYKDTYAKYIQSINASANASANTLNMVDNSSWWGEGDLSQSQVADKDECKSMCYNTPLCSGATFNAETRYCWMRKGMGEVIPNSNGASSTAIVNVSYQYMYQLNELNNKLVTLIDKLRPIMVNNEPNNDINISSANLESHYQSLLKQKRMIIKEMKDIANIKESTNIATTQNMQAYLSYYYLAIFVLFLLCMIVSEVLGLNLFTKLFAIAFICVIIIGAVRYA